MKGARMDREYWYEATSPHNLYAALKKCCKGVRWKDSVVGYEDRGLLHSVELSNALRSGTYHISKYQKFEVFEPKHREIVASRLVDRQWQRSLCDAGLYDDITEHFTADNCACQVGRGTDYATSRLKSQLSSFARKCGDGWVLKCDVRKFFASIPHDVAKAAIAKRTFDPRAAQSAFDVIDSFDGDVGLGLGSQMSQLTALAVLDDLDHLVRERLGVRGYVRYMDDLILIHEDKSHLALCLDAISAYLSDIGLQLNEKTALQPIGHGVWFLKWRYVITDSGKVLMLCDPKKLPRWMGRLRKVWEREEIGLSEPDSTEQVFRCYLAHLAMGDTHKERDRLVRFYHELIGDDGID